MSFNAIRKGIKDCLDTIPGLNAYAYMPDTLKLPAAFPSPDRGDYSYSMAENILCEMAIMVLVDLAKSFKDAQKELDLFIEETGTKSIAAAINTDNTLGGACELCRVQNFQEYSFILYAGNQYLGCRIILEIYK